MKANKFALTTAVTNVYKLFSDKFKALFTLTNYIAGLTAK